MVHAHRLIRKNQCRKIIFINHSAHQHTDLDITLPASRMPLRIEALDKLKTGQNFENDDTRLASVSTRITGGDSAPSTNRISAGGSAPSTNRKEDAPSYRLRVGADNSVPQPQATPRRDSAQPPATPRRDSAAADGAATEHSAEASKPINKQKSHFHPYSWVASGTCPFYHKNGLPKNVWTAPIPEPCQTPRTRVFVTKLTPDYKVLPEPTPTPTPKSPERTPTPTRKVYLEIGMLPLGGRRALDGSLLGYTVKVPKPKRSGSKSL